MREEKEKFNVCIFVMQGKSQELNINKWVVQDGYISTKLFSETRKKVYRELSLKKDKYVAENIEENQPIQFKNTNAIFYQNSKQTRQLKLYYKDLDRADD